MSSTTQAQVSIAGVVIDSEAYDKRIRMMSGDSIQNYDYHMNTDCILQIGQFLRSTAVAVVLVVLYIILFVTLLKLNEPRLKYNNHYFVHTHWH